MVEDTAKAKLMITELSEFLRYSLMSGDLSEVTIKAELETIRNYLSIQKKRFEDKLDITFTIDPATENYSIFSFLLHPLVENAIKYGMQTSPMPLKIKIGAEILDRTLEITVSNTGKWIVQSETDNSASTGTGLENIKARLDNSYPGRYNMKIFEDDGYVNVKIAIKFAER